MKLYITPGSPYARLTRIMVLEKRLEHRIEIVTAQTRAADSPYYRIARSGRVPYLERDDGVGLEESAVICRYLDHLDGQPEFDLPAGDQGWELARPGALASSLMDGLAVWGREISRPRHEQSPTVIGHETERARRLIDHWETEIDHPLMRGPLNLAQMTLCCALGLKLRHRDFRWRDGHPKLVDWFSGISARPSLAKTLPAAGHWQLFRPCNRRYLARVNLRLINCS
jgi:glutathione S-transferase